MIITRTGRVRELTRSSRSKFKMIRYQFSAAQVSSFNIFWKVCNVQFSSGYEDQVPPFSSFSLVHSVQLTNPSGPDSDCPGWLGSAQARFSPSSLQLFGGSKGAVLGPLQWKSQLAGLGLVSWVEECALCWLCLLTRLGCGVVSE